MGGSALPGTVMGEGCARRSTLCQVCTNSFKGTCLQ
jgi:hypothetical protein